MTLGAKLIWSQNNHLHIFKNKMLDANIILTQYFTLKICVLFDTIFHVLMPLKFAISYHKPTTRLE